MAELTQIAFDFDNLPPAPPVLEVKPPVVEARNKKVMVLPTAVSVAKPKSTRGRKSIKELSLTVDLIEIPEDELLFQKSYYSIGKVAEMFKVNSSLIRLWANEFDVLQPKKNGKGDRLFRPEDVKNIQLIYHLMRERKYTTQGTRDFIKHHKQANEKFELIGALKRVKGFLNELKANL